MSKKIVSTAVQDTNVAFENGKSCQIKHLSDQSSTKYHHDGTIINGCVNELVRGLFSFFAQQRIQFGLAGLFGGFSMALGYYPRSGARRDNKNVLAPCYFNGVCGIFVGAGVKLIKSARRPISFYPRKPEIEVTYCRVYRLRKKKLGHSLV